MISMTTSVKAFDTTATLTSASWFAEAYAMGYELYIPSTTLWGENEPWPEVAGQLELALSAGMKIAAYARNPEWWRAALQACEPYQDRLQFFCLDIETDPGVPVTDAMVGGVRSWDVRPVIYSGYGMWPEVMGSNNADFSDIPLWDTNVTGAVSADFAADIDSPEPVQYGGWNTSDNPRIGIQQGFNTTLNGVIVNVSSFVSPLYAGGPGPARPTWPGCAPRGTRSPAGTGRRMRKRSGWSWTAWTREP
jgi:hypothetical protein